MSDRCGFRFWRSFLIAILLPAFKGAADFRWDFHLALNPAASDEGGIEPRQNFFQRQRHHHAIAIILQTKYFWKGGAQLAKRKFHSAFRKLGQNFFQRD